MKGGLSMHILIIPSWYNNDKRPTLGSFFREQAKVLKRSGLEVSLIYPHLTWRKLLNGTLNKEIIFYDDEGVFTYRTDEFKVPRSTAYGYNLSFYKGIKRLYNRVVSDIGKPDIIHAHSCVWGGYSAMKIAQVENIPLVITEHFTGFSRNIIKNYEKPLIRKQFKSADKIIAVSEGLKKDIMDYCGGKNIDVIPNMVNIDFFNIKQSIYKEKFIFLSVSYLTHKKGIDILIKAFANLFKGKNVELHIGGDGEEKKSLEELAKDLKIECQVKFLGALSRDEVNDAMNQCNIFVLPSRFETFGVVFIEALACGKPIIATKTGGPDDIVNRNNGLLADVGSLESLKKCMLDIYKNYNFYNPKIIREDCRNRFSEQVVANKIINIYRDIIK